MPFKQELEEILKNNSLLPSDMEAIFCAIGEVFMLAAEKLKANEPYATQSIAKLQEAGRTIEDLDDFIEHYSYE